MSVRRINLFFRVFYVAALVAAATAPEKARALGTIKKFVLSQCLANSGKCLRAEALTAEGSQFQPIFVLNQVEVTVQDQKSGMISKDKSERAYVNFDTQMLVLSIENGAKERSYRLTDLTVETWNLR